MNNVSDDEIDKDLAENVPGREIELDDIDSNEDKDDDFVLSNG